MMFHVLLLAFWSPSSAEGFGDYFDFESSIDEDNLGFLAKMDHELIGENLDFFRCDGRRGVDARRGR
jgi:hypothetical protein